MDVLRGHTRILIDTSVWIYHFERHAKFGAAATQVLAAVEAGRFAGVVSELVLTELLVRPLQLGRQDIADEYELLLGHFPNLEFVQVSRDVLVEAAHLRARFGLRTPDAIMLATGLSANTTAAITNDGAWSKVDLIKVVTLSDIISR